MGVPGAGWVLGLLVMDRQRSSAELPSNGRPVFSPNPMGSLQLEVHLVYLALRVVVSEDSSPLQLLLRSARKKGSQLHSIFGLCFPWAPMGLCC